MGDEYNSLFFELGNILPCFSRAINFFIEQLFPRIQIRKMSKLSKYIPAKDDALDTKPFRPMKLTDRSSKCGGLLFLAPN
jgi:hypothetical protein